MAQTLTKRSITNSSLLAWTLIGETSVANDNPGFDGYVTSDCGGIVNRVFNDHHYTQTPEEAVRDVFRAGLNVNCDDFGRREVGYLQSALDQKLLTLAEVEKRLAEGFRVRMRLSHFDPTGPLQQIPLSELCSAETAGIARAGAAQGATLIKNTAGTLPLKRTLRSVAVIGPNSNLSEAVAGYYGGRQVCGGVYPSMIDAVRQYVPSAVSATGVPSVRSNNTTDVAAAAALAKGKDAVVLVLGTDLTIAKEGHDTDTISLSAGQQALLVAVAEAATSPVTVVLLTAVPLDISSMLQNPNVGAILHAGQPSIQTLGIGDVLFGHTVPSGRMARAWISAGQERGGRLVLFAFCSIRETQHGPRPCAVQMRSLEF